MFEFYTIAIIALLAVISPGPDFFIVAKYALSSNRRAACYTSLGIGAGLLVHSTYCILGLAVVIQHSLVLFSIIKYCGAAYLMYLGVKSFLSKNDHVDLNKPKASSVSYCKAFRDGFLTNVLNPKCALFMISIFTLFVKADTPTLVSAIYAVEIILVSIAWFIFLSYGLTHSIIKRRIEKVQGLISRVIGVVLFGLGLAVIFEAR